MRMFFVAALMVAATPALAVDFTAPLIDEGGKPYCIRMESQPDATVPKCAEELTIGRFVAEALNLPESNLKPEDIVSRGILALRVRSGHDVELDDKARDLIKAQLFAAVSKLNYRPIAIVKALQIIDPGAVKDK